MNRLVWIAGVLVLGAAAAFLAFSLREQPALKQTSYVAQADWVPVPPASEKAESYYRSGNLLWVADALWGFLVSSLFLSTGLSARIRKWAQDVSRAWFWTLLLYGTIYLLLNFLLCLPLSYYEDFFRQHAYGLSNQSLEKWLNDSLKSLMVGIVAGALILWLPYWLMEKSPRRWWFYAALVSLPIMFFVMLISPVWIDPLFNQFGPMKNKALEGRILALAQSAGIDGSRVYEVDKSIDTEEVDAYVTGLMGTKRIVLWDTILAKMDEEELLVVMGHEMGHYVLHHVLKGVLFTFLLILIALYPLYRLSVLLMDRFKGLFGFDRVADVASLPLLVLLLGFFSFLLSPFELAFSRHIEHEADRFALEITRDNHAAATAFVKLQAQNLDIPRPGTIYKLWRASHPSIGERIDFCNTYHPWRIGEPLKYGYLFRKMNPIPNPLRKR